MLMSRIRYRNRYSKYFKQKNINIEKVYTNMIDLQYQEKNY